MPEVAAEVKEEVEPYIVDIEVAKKAMGYSDSTMYRHINKAKTGKSTFPYRQDMPRAPYGFVISELKLWRWNVTQGLTT